MNLIICDIPWYSGLSHYALEVAKILKKKEELLWATEKNTPLYEKLKQENIPVIKIKSRKPINFFENYKLILKALKKPPENILTFTGNSFSLGYLLKKKFNSKLIRFRTESYNIKKNIFNKLLYKKAYIIVAGSEKMKNSIKKLGVKNVVVIYLGIDIEKITKKEIKNFHTVGFLGRLDKIKGIDVLWKAMNIVWKQNPEIELLIAGKQEYYRWENIRNNFKGKVKYLGFIKEKEKENFFKDISIGIISSIASEETSRVLLEYFANARTVIATRVGIIPEIIEENIDGILIEPNNPEELSRNIISILKNTELLKNLCFNARKKVELYFNINIFKNKILNLIK